MKLVKCPCGGLAEFDSIGTNRKAKRKKALEALAETQTKYKEKRNSLNAKAVKFAIVEAVALKADVVEVRCIECGAFVWHKDTEDAVKNRWNRAVEKLGKIDKCCKASRNLTVDFDGMEIIKCETCSRRHMPLKAVAQHPGGRT